MRETLFANCTPKILQFKIHAKYYCLCNMIIFSLIIVDHMGTEFILAFPLNYGTSQYIHIYILSNELRFNGSIFSPHPGISRNFSSTTGFVVLNLPVSVELPEGRSNQGIYIKSSQPVTVIGLDHYQCCTGEGFYVYKKQSLGTHYTSVSLAPSQRAYLAIIGTVDQTQVQVTLNSTVVITYNGHSYTNGDTFILSVDNMEAVQIFSKGDLSGSIVNSNKPVAVMTGNECFSGLGTDCNHQVEYLISSDNCGKEYIVPALKGTKKMLRIFAHFDGTTVVVRGQSLTINATVSTDHMKEIHVIPDESYSIIADQSVCVYIIAAVGAKSGANPMTAYLPSIDQYANDMVFPKPTIQVFSNYLSVAIKSQALSNLRINNNTLSNTKINKILLENTEYSTFWLELPNDTSTYHVWSISPYDRFGAIAYGNKFDEAYGYPAAINL